MDPKLAKQIGKMNGRMTELDIALKNPNLSNTEIKDLQREYRNLRKQYSTAVNRANRLKGQHGVQDKLRYYRWRSTDESLSKRQRSYAKMRVSQLSGLKGL